MSTTSIKPHLSALSPPTMMKSISHPILQKILLPTNLREGSMDIEFPLITLPRITILILIFLIPTVTLLLKNNANSAKIP